MDELINLSKKKYHNRFFEMLENESLKIAELKVEKRLGSLEQKKLNFPIA